MPKTLKIIIVTVSILATILTIYIAPKVIPYTPPSPNIVKTDQGSFELRLSVDNGFYANNNNYSFETYKEYEGYAKDYYYRISTFVKNPNLIINQYVIHPGDGPIGSSIRLSINAENNPRLFEAIYIHEYRTNKFNFQAYPTYSKEGDRKNNTLEELLQTPEYQNRKFN